MDVPGGLACGCVYAASKPCYERILSANLRSRLLRSACSCRLFQLYGPSVSMCKKPMYRDEMKAFANVVAALFAFPDQGSPAGAAVACKDLGR